MNQTLIILRGAPASGKSSIARALRNFDKKVAWLKVDNFKPFFADDASGALEYVNGSSIATLDYLLANGFSVVMEGVFQNPACIEDALAIAKSKNISAHAYDLRCSLETLLERDQNRDEVKSGYSKPVDYSVLEKIHNTLQSNPSKDAEIFDVEDKSLNECIEFFQKFIT